MYSYFGVCPNAKESLILFEAVKQGLIPTVSDRLNEEQRKGIVSGAIYIWDESKNPIRRWTDGMTWSNSRVVGGFLEYRESYPDPLHIRQGRYSIKPNGLRKRSICLPVDGQSSLRLIAYFSYNDIINNRLIPPSKHPAFQEIVKNIEKNPEFEETLSFLSSGKRRKRSSKVNKNVGGYSSSSDADGPSPPTTPGMHDISPIEAPPAAQPQQPVYSSSLSVSPQHSWPASVPSVSSNPLIFSSHSIQQPQQPQQQPQHSAQPFSATYVPHTLSSSSPVMHYASLNAVHGTLSSSAPTSSHISFHNPLHNTAPVMSASVPGPASLHIPPGIHNNVKTNIYESHQLPPIHTTPDIGSTQEVASQFSAKEVLRNNTLPSPIWMPQTIQRMNSEDRRALKLLDATSTQTHTPNSTPPK